MVMLASRFRLSGRAALHQQLPDAFDHDLAVDRDLDGLARLHYGDGDFVVMKPGRYVICAVSGKQVPLEALRYWSAELQEAYASPAEALKRWQELNP